MKKIFVDYVDGWKRYFEFYGESSVSQFFYFILLNGLIIIGLLALFLWIFFQDTVVRLQLLNLSKIFPWNYESDGSTIFYNFQDLNFNFNLPAYLTFSLSFIFAYKLLLIIPILALIIRRLNAINFSYWHLLWLFLPIIGYLILFIILLIPSKPDQNFYSTLN